jgi:hypothetical protein
MMENILNKVKYTVSKYHGNVQLWDACNGLSNCQSTGLDDAQSFKLACNVINLIHNLDPKTPLIFSVDIPAAENMRLNNRAINPLVFAESLIRAHDRSIAGIGLELNLNTWPNGTLPLDLPGLSDLIDHWSSQNRSLLVRLTTPLDLSPPSLQPLDNSKNKNAYRFKLELSSQSTHFCNSAMAILLRSIDGSLFMAASSCPIHSPS